MIEWVGLFYDVAKDLKEYLTWDEAERLVENEWLEKSGFGAEAKAKGMELRWSKPERVATRQTEGWEILHEIDKGKRVRNKLVRYDGTVLIGKQ